MSAGANVSCGVLLLTALISLVPATFLAQLPQFRIDSNTVAIYATVVDRNGRLVAGLGRDDFEIEDDGKRQIVTVFDTDPQPVTAIIMLDRSLSVVADSKLVERAVDQFVARMLPIDRARLGAFSYMTELLPDTFTHDRGELLVALRLLKDQGGPSPIWRTTSGAIDTLEGESGRRVVVLFTDGYDGQRRGEPPVTATMVADRAQSADVMVYTIGQQVSMLGDTTRQRPSGWLGYVADQTGGGFIELRPDTDLVTAFARVADELHSQYALGFVPEKLDGKEHSLRVRVKREGLVVRSRRGYVARPR